MNTDSWPYLEKAVNNADLSEFQKIELAFLILTSRMILMIRSYHGKDTKRFIAGKPTKLPPDILERAALKLLDLDNAVELEDLRFPPSNNLEALKHDRLGQYSIRINDQWRICFRWIDGQTYDVEITDYH
jgi:proteic killer suppression protein